MRVYGGNQQGAVWKINYELLKIQNPSLYQELMQIDDVKKPISKEEKAKAWNDWVESKRKQRNET